MESKLTAVADGFFLSGAVDEDASHGFGGRDVEVAAVVPTGFGFVAGNTEIGFVNEGGGAEGLAGRFVGHFLRGEFAQVVVEGGKDLGGSSLVRRIE